MMRPSEMVKDQETVGDRAKEVTELTVSEQIIGKDALTTKRERKDAWLIIRTSSNYSL